LPSDSKTLGVLRGMKERGLRRLDFRMGGVQSNAEIDKLFTRS
jgi:hypothetical protein